MARTIRPGHRRNSLLVTTSTAFGGDTAASRLVLENGSSLAISSNLTHDVTINGAANISGTGHGLAIVTGSGPQPRDFGSNLTVTALSLTMAAS